jgi:tetratricopeptide (TPR) repeat protein
LIGKHEEALKDFNQAIELDGKDAWAIARRGLTSWLMNNYEEALKDFDRAIELSEKDAWDLSGDGQARGGAEGLRPGDRVG